MNAINRIELAIRRAASQMPAGPATGFKLVADELSALTHEGLETQVQLDEYREQQTPTSR